MFEFLKNIMNNEELTLTGEDSPVHRILKTDIEKKKTISFFTS